MTDKEQLNQAIRALEAQRSILGDAVVETTLQALRKQLQELEAADKKEQRKLATVLFMDTVGSTEITQALDPEENLEIMGGAIRLLSAPIEEHGGRIVRTMGDGLLAVFGIPLANENDPDRAVYSALQMLAIAREYADELKRSWGIPDYQVRLGINTGLVAVSGSEGREEISGAVVNLAARLEAAADPGTVLISHDTYQHIRGVFDLQPLAPIMAKGFPEPMPVYRVLAAKARSFRSRRRGVEGVETRMVGREIELKALQDAYLTVANEGQHRVVTIVGEAGLGKSRLLYEFENWADLQPVRERVFRGRANSESRILPYALLRNLFAFHFNIQDDDAASVAREKIVAGFSEELGAGPEGDPGSNSEMQAHFIGHLLGYDFRSSRHLALIMANPQQLRDRALSYLQGYFEVVCASGPALVLLEDLHWADDSSLDAISWLSLALQNQPVLVVGTARPELFERRPHWTEKQPLHQGLELRPLSEQDSRSLAVEVLQRAENIPDALLKVILSNSEGNPFYVEELVKMLVQQGVIVKGDERWLVRVERLEEVQVPITLSGVLQARLDSLAEEERTVLQQASVVGRVFWDAVVMYLNRQLREAQGDERIEQTLLALREKEIVFRRDSSVFAGATEYIFKHALFRQVIYESVFVRARRTFHALVADWLIEHSGGRSEEVAGLIANHLEHAGRLEEALVYLRRAGEEATERFAVVEALRFYDQAVELVAEHSEAFTGEEMAQLRGQRGGVQALAGDFEAAVADISFALQVAEHAHDLRAQRALVTNLGMVYRRADDYENALPLLSRAVEAARAGGDQRAVADTLFHLASVIWSQGENTKATQLHQEALEISRSLGLNDLVAVQAFHGRAEAYWIDGRPDLALQLFKESLQLSRQIGDRGYEAENLQMIGILSSGSDGIADYRGAKEASEAALEICRAAHLDWHLLPTLESLSKAYRGLGDYQIAYRLIIEANQLAEDMGVTRFLSFQFHSLALLCQDLGLSLQAEVFFQRALQVSEEANSLFWLPAIKASLAVAHLRQGDLAVGPMLEGALAFALERGQNLHAARCYEGLAELAIVKGKHEQGLGHADNLLALAELGGMRERMAQAHRWRGVALQAMGRTEQAGNELRRAAVLAQAIGSPRLLWEVHEALARFYSELGNSQKALHHNDEVKKIVERIAAGLEDKSLKTGLPLAS
jgi:class 3 adenylate cyclase/tetratricopeptide (TPR) repeat protein